VYNADASRQESGAQIVAAYKVLDEKSLTRKIKKTGKRHLDAARISIEKSSELRTVERPKQVLFGGARIHD